LGDFTKYRKGNEKMGSNIVTGIAGRRYEEQCFRQEHIAKIKYQKGCALEITLGGRGDDEKRRKILGWVEGNYPAFILVRVDTPRGPYRMSLNKKDIAMKEIKIREVV
jgi:hypothetical protein